MNLYQVFTQTRILSSGSQDSKSYLVLVLIFVVLQSPHASVSPVPAPTLLASQHATHTLLPTQIFISPPHLRSFILLQILTPSPCSDSLRHLCLLLCSRLCCFFSLFNSQPVPKNLSVLLFSQPFAAQGHILVLGAVQHRTVVLSGLCKMLISAANSLGRISVCSPPDFFLPAYCLLSIFACFLSIKNY